jgi:hypothetical protein
VTLTSGEELTLFDPAPYSDPARRRRHVTRPVDGEVVVDAGTRTVDGCWHLVSTSRTASPLAHVVTGVVNIFGAAPLACGGSGRRITVDPGTPLPACPKCVRAHPPDLAPINPDKENPMPWNIAAPGDGRPTHLPEPIDLAVVRHLLSAAQVETWTTYTARRSEVDEARAAELAHRSRERHGSDGAAVAEARARDADAVGRDTFPPKERKAT